MSKTYDTNNIFAKIIRKELPCSLVYEDENIIAFNDIEPAAPVHILVLPKGEYISFDDFMINAGAKIIADYFMAIQKISTQVGANEKGYRIISNHGEDASQTVPHFHTHILAGKPLGGLLVDDNNIR